MRYRFPDLPGLDRLLDPDNPSLTLLTLKNAAKVLGQRIRIELAA